MDRVATLLLLFALLTAFVGDAAASCREIANEEMLEYFCEGGHPADLITIPETTEKLRIIKMPLRRITFDTFSRFGGNLWVLSCSHCEITDIDADAFRHLVNLQQLSLDNNRLTTVRASWFEGLDYLTYLDLNYNDIRDIEDGVYKNLLGLVDLRIAGNRLRCLNLDEMSHLKELKRIFLNENSDFACPHAVSKFLENQGVAFEQDPEWRRLASDTIDIDVPPSHVEEDRESETMPAHRERLHPDRKPPPEESKGPYATRNKTFYPDHSEYHQRHKRPPTTTVRPMTPKQQKELPQVESRFPDAISSHMPSESSSRQVMPYPYSTPEMPPSEDIKMSGTDDGPSRTEHTMYPPHPTQETTPHWSYSTPERSRAPPMTSILSEDIRTAGTDRPPERILTYPYIPTHETIGASGRSSQAGNTVTYPLYVTTSNGLERMPHGSIQVAHPSSDVSGMIIWSTNDSIEHSVDPSWIRHEQSRHPVATEGNDGVTWSTKTPYYGHDPRKMIVESSPESDDGLFVATDRPVEYDPSQTTTMAVSDVHYVRPSPPELMHSPATDEFYQAPYYESSVTMHPPLQNYQNGYGAAAGVRPIETTTDKPLPECPDSSAPKVQPTAALVTLVIVTIFGRAVGF